MFPEIVITFPEIVITFQRIVLTFTEIVLIFLEIVLIDGVRDAFVITPFINKFLFNPVFAYIETLLLLLLLFFV